MAIEIKVPVLPESVADASIAAWHKKPGEHINEGETLVDLETDKVVLEVPAPASGILESISAPQGTLVKGNQVIGILVAGETEAKKEAVGATRRSPSPDVPELSPAVRRMVKEHEVDVSQVKGSGKSGRVTKDDVAAVITRHGNRVEERVPMSRLRTRVAERLLQVQQNSAILTTFNEVNMQPVMELRTKYKDSFEKRHGVKLGFMSFFTAAVVAALKRFPIVNASIDGNDIIYHAYQDIGVAVSTEKGLVVPVLRNVEQMSMADVEKTIRDLSLKARDGKLSLEEMTGGTFTITNGGVFGSLFSTPIINPPQSAILGMHAIKETPVAENGQVVIRPMMYLALSYDHRIIDGKDSVQFLVAVKEALEDPARLLLGL
ncbi:MAG: 2-oxoglutarate dehydrogenase complex dihydrolipoyllysine-residue succinyltransferase [Gammaproteobacteria bacterium]|nr:2-oxoglutarate dehydrogenase complex dihydrolipoyllysine-residue succinyltransferase [Gammaproteobacteria bacterium]